MTQHNNECGIPNRVGSALRLTYEDAIIGIEYYDAPSKIYSQYVLERVSRFPTTR
jgi:hypothetical protein